MRNIKIGCDNAAVELKKIIVEFLAKKGVPVEDIGCDSENDKTYYPTIAQRVCQKVIDSGYQARGILICGTGCRDTITFSRCSICLHMYSTWLADT